MAAVAEKLVAAVKVAVVMVVLVVFVVLLAETVVLRLSPGFAESGERTARGVKAILPTLPSV